MSMKKIFSFIAAVLFAGSMMAADVLSIDFTQGQGEWTINNVTLPQGYDTIWSQTSSYGMKATAYLGNANHASEAWLVSPSFSLEGLDSIILSFSHARKFGNLDQLSVVAKSANDAQWTTLQVSAWPDGSSWSFVDAQADLTGFAGDPSVQIAFVYTSSDNAAATWEIKTVLITDAGDLPPVEQPDVVFTGADFLGQGTSTSGSPVAAEKDGVSFTCDKGYSDDEHSTLRCYKNGVINITSTSEQIGKLVFKFFSTYTGDLDPEVVVNANEWSYTLTNQARIEKLEIYFGEYTPIVPDIDTINVTEAIAIAAALTPEKGKSASTEKKYAVKGFVVGISTSKTNTFYLADEQGAYGEFQAYQCASVDSEVAENDYVIVTGKIMHYYGESASSGEFHSYEISGGTLVHTEAPQGIENIVLTEKAQKVVVDGVIYIVRDNKLFNLQGTQIR